MQAGADFRAILIADCGIEHTRVTLVDIVGENEYRLVSQTELPTTAEPPSAAAASTPLPAGPHTAAPAQATLDLSFNNYADAVSGGWAEQLS